MKHLRILLLLIAFAVQSQASVTQIVATVYFTNVVNGVTNGGTITINGDVRRYTNGVLNNAATWIQSTNIVGWAATNTLSHLAQYRATGTEYVGATNTNAVIIAGSVGNMTHTVTLSAGIGTNTYVTNVYGDYLGFGGPLASIPTPAGRTNIGSKIIEAIGNGYTTNQVPTVAGGARGFSNYIDSVTQQAMTNKVTYLGTNNGGLIDGARITNFVSLSGSNGTIADLNIQRGSLLNATNISGTNALFTNVFLQHVTFKDARITGTNIGVTNGFAVSVTNINPVTSNLVNYGNSIRSEGTGGNSLQVGSNAVASGLRSVSIGNNSIATNTDSIAIGNSAISTNIESVAIGNAARAYGEYGLAVGNDSRATNEGSAFGFGARAEGLYSIAVGVDSVAYADSSISITRDSGVFDFGAILIGFGGVATKAYSVGIGYGATATHSNSAAIGPPDHAGTGTATTTTNQIVLGTANHSTYIPGTLSAVAISNLTTLANSTNILRGDLSFPRSTVTTVANGHNTINVGTNVFVDLTGSPSAAWTWGGITGGNRDGKFLVVRNNTGYSADILDNSGTEPTAALRIDTPTGTNVTLNAAGLAEFIYDASASRWILLNVFNTATPTASATNALSSLATNGVAVSSLLTNLNLIPGTGITFNTTNTSGNVSLQINSSGGGAGLSGSTNYLPLRPTSFLPTATNMAYADETLQTPFLAFPHTNGVGSVISLAATAGELIVPADYATNTLALEFGVINTATNGPNASNFVFLAEILRHNHTGQTSTNDAQVGPFDGGTSAFTVTVAASHTGTNKVQWVSGSISNCTLAANESFSLRLSRANTNASDLIGAGVAGVTAARLRYTRP